MVPDFIDDINVLPHFVNITGLDHFHGVEISTILHRKNIDILIGQSDKVLLIVLVKSGKAKNRMILIIIMCLGDLDRLLAEANKWSQSLTSVKAEELRLIVCLMLANMSLCLVLNALD